MPQSTSAPGSTWRATSTELPSLRAASSASAAEATPSTTPPPRALCAGPSSLTTTGPPSSSKAAAASAGVDARRRSANGDAEAFENERRLVLGQRSRPDEEVGDVGLRRGSRDGREGPPIRDAGDRAHRVARAAEKRHVELARKLLEPARRVGAVHGRHGAEDVSPLVPQASERSQRQLAPLVVRPVAELREIGLGEEDVELS